MVKRFLAAWWWVPVLAILCLPVSFVVTFLLSPLWSWIEATTGLESMGHSGPAGWCFWTIYGLLTVVCLAVALLLKRWARQQSPLPPG